MHLSTLCIRNFRRLKDVRIDVDREASIFVGSNNSGKTSATAILQLFLGASRERFSVYDFNADSWAIFDQIGPESLGPVQFPTIELDLWFSVTDKDLHRVMKLLPSLTWSDLPIGVRMKFAPRNSIELLSNYNLAKSDAQKGIIQGDGSNLPYHPWPETMVDYLKKRLKDEYQVSYHVLDRSEFDAELREKPGYSPSELGDAKESGESIIKSLIRVDFLHAQRHLADETKGRAEDLSKRLSRFYQRNLEQHLGDHEALRALARSETQLNEHLKAVFAPILDRLNSLGYPGFAEPYLVIRSALEPASILNQNASVHYALRDPDKADTPGPGLTLPDKYNGLGFKNLIYMVIEILDFHHQWVDQAQGRPPLHLVIIEEPEAHLHAQLQQVFIRQILKLLPQDSPLFTSQLIITTHSPNMIYERGFDPIRYFRRSSPKVAGNYTEVLNLSNFKGTETNTREFVVRYMKLTHCDLFFADAAILVEGDVERLLLPLMVEQVAEELRSRYLTILQLGGAFAHKFRELIHFLGLTTLVITDLDSVSPTANASTAGQDQAISGTEEDGDEDESEAEIGQEPEKKKRVALSSCIVETPGAVTSNETLKQWLPGLSSISDLLSADVALKAPVPTETERASVRVAYQTQQTVVWNGETEELAGRTFEVSFAYENLDWCQNLVRKNLGLRVVTKRNPSPLLSQLAESIHDRVKGSGFSKTGFALALIMEDPKQWAVPSYIREGLQWLNDQLRTRESPATVVPPSSAETEKDRDDAAD